MEFILRWLSVRKLCSRTQVTEIKHQGLLAIHVYTSSLLSSRAHGKSRRLTLGDFLSGSLNGLDPSLKVRVNLAAVESFS